MLEWLIKKILGSGIAEKILRTKVLSIAASIAAWLAINNIVKDESGATQAISAIFIGILDLTFMIVHAWTERAAILKGAKRR